MFLNRIRVESWKTLREAVELADLSPNLNVVHGPNETGKSTLMDAICRGFFDRHRTGGEEMKVRQPWGSELGPRVEIDFTIGEKRYGLDKKFLLSPGSMLRQVTGGVWEKLAEGASADERTLQLVSGEGSSKGLTKSVHWGLGQVLWACQGDATRLSVGDGQQARLREALQLTLDSTAGGAVEGEIRKRYDAVYTPEGRLRGGKQQADVTRLETELAIAEKLVIDLEAKRRDAELLEHDLRTAIDERDAVVRQLDAVRRTLEQARGRLLAMSEAQRVYEQLEHAARHTQAEWVSMNAATRDLRAADENVTVGRRAVREAESADHEATAAQAAAQSRTKAATESRDDARRRLARDEESLAAAQRLVAFLADRLSLDSVQRKITRADELRERVAGTERQQADLRAPSADQLKALRALDRQRADVRAKVEAASLTVTFEPQRSLDVNITIDRAAPQPQTVDAPLSVKAVSALAIAIDGVGRIVVRAGDSDAATMSDQLRALDRAWQAQTAAFAADELHALEALAAQHAAMDAAAAGWRALLAEGGELAALRAQAADLAAQQRVALVEDPTLADRTESPDDAKAAVKKLLAEKRASTTAIATAEDVVEAARTAQKQTETDHGRTTKSLGEARAVVGEREREAARLRAADGLDDAARAAALAEALSASDAARQRLAAAPRPPVAEANQEIESLDRQAAALQHRLSALDQQTGSLDGRLKQAGAAGLYSQWVEASEAVESLRVRRDRARLDAEAIRLLWTTVERHKKQVFEAVIQPIRHTVQTSLNQLIGPRYDGVDFDEQLQPKSVRPAGRGGMDTPPAIDALSFGTKEQLMLLVRLALGRLLSRQIGRQCVILDDPLVNADPRRQRSALRLLEEAARETQVIVFTCHPHAYESAAAKTFDLKALVDASQSTAVG